MYRYTSAKCVTLDDTTLRAMVGEEMCYQVVQDDDSEQLRRERIGASNKVGLYKLTP